MKEKYITVNLDGISLGVEYIYYPSYKGARDSLGGVRGAGPPLEPDEPESIEINTVYTTDDITSLLSEKQISKIEEAVLEELNQEPDEEAL